MWLTTLALAQDARLTPIAESGSGPDASILWDGARWVRFASAGAGITRATSPDGLIWSAATEVIAGATQPSVTYGAELDGKPWVMAMTLPTVPASVGRALSEDGEVWTHDDAPWYACAGECAAPTLFHIGRYWILNHSEHTDSVDGMRVHHSEDGVTWSSGIVHTSPDGADDPDILFIDSAWLLVTSVADELTLWSAPEIEGEKAVVATGSGGPSAFFRDGSGAREKGASAIWLSGNETWTLALVDGETSTDGFSCAVDAPPSDGPHGDDGWALQDGCVLSLGERPADGAEELRLIAVGSGTLSVAWGEWSGTWRVDGPVDTSLPLDGAGGSLSITASGAVTLLHLQASGTSAWTPTDSGAPDTADKADTGAARGPDCGCAAVRPEHLFFAFALAAALGRRRPWPER